MIGRNTPTGDQVVITEPDFDRLNQLAHSQRYRATNPTPTANLTGELGRATVVRPDTVPRNVVTMNSRVRVRDLATGECETYLLVYPEHANIDEGKLSVLAPLGTALLGARTGHTIDVKAPVGLRRLKVERVLYQPEAAGERGGASAGATAGTLVTRPGPAPGARS